MVRVTAPRDKRIAAGMAIWLMRDTAGPLSLATSFARCCFADSLDRYIAVHTMFVGCAMKAPMYLPRIYAERPPLFWQNKAKHIVQLRRGVR
jgi:hypothetical protein